MLATAHCTNLARVNYSISQAITAQIDKENAMTLGTATFCITAMRRLLTVALLFLLVICASAQTQTISTSPTDGSTPLALAPGAPAGSYVLSGFEVINPYNGRLNFRLPLAQSAGRGGAQMTAGLTIDPQPWRVGHARIKNLLTGEIERDSYVPTADDGLGLKPGYGPGVLDGRQSGTYYPLRCLPFNNAAFDKTLTRLTFTAADGTQYELRDQLNGGQPIVTRCANTSRGQVFVTADGSSATFISDTPIFDAKYQVGAGNLIAPSGHLMLRDGTRYRIDNGLVSWMRDRNGNRLTFAYNLGSVTSITDSLNRQVTIEYHVSDVAPYGICDRITFKGFGGASRIIRISKTNLGNALRAGFTTQTLSQLFPTLNGASSLITFNPTVVSAVWLPDGRRYQFSYNSYGELARVDLPTGGAIEYDYTPDSGVFGFQNPEAGQFFGNPQEYAVDRRLIERRVYPDGQTLEGKTTYTLTPGNFFDPGDKVVVDHRDASNTLLAREKHYYYGSSATSLTQGPVDYPAWRDGKEYQTDWFGADGTTVLRRVTNTWEQRAPVSWWTGDSTLAPPNDPRLIETLTTLTETNLVAKQTFSYDQYNNQTDVYEYDFGARLPGTLIRHTHTDYVTLNNGVDYAANTNIHIRSLPRQMQVFDAGEVLRAQITYEYDNYNQSDPDVFHAALSDCLGISGHDGAFSAGYLPRGNVTKTTQSLLNNSGGVTGSISSHVQYDIAGNVVKAIDPRSTATPLNIIATTFDFRDNFGSPDDPAAQSSENPANNAPGELGGQMSYAFPFKITNALGHKAYTKYDYHLGRPALSEDANGVKSNTYFNDALDRPTRGIRAIGTPAASQSVIVYNDSDSPVNGYPARSITTISDKDVFGESNSGSGLKSVALFDGLGRTWRGAAYEGSTWSIKDTQFDAMGRVSQVSNPYRAADPALASAPDGLWTTTVYDALGRVIQVVTPDGTHVDTAYSGNQVTVTDQAGKKRRSETDALGRLIKVTEDPDGLNYDTYYSYDALGNLLQVAQGSQTRTFVYDSLSRLAWAINPESGKVTYAYDPGGSLIEKTDARGVKTTMTYDALNRVKSKTYAGTPSGGTEEANATPPVNYFYDDYSTLPSGAPTWPGTPSKGRLIGVTYGSGSEGTYYSYDAAGRITTNHQRQGTSNYATRYTYNLAGGVTLEQRGNYLNNVWTDYFRNSWAYDNAGRISGVAKSKTPFQSFTPLATNISYTPSWALQSETYGNGLIHSIGYNERQQPTEIRLGRPDNLESVFTIYSMYGTANNVNDQDAEISLAQNNGNIARIRYSVSGTIQYTQTFQYDALNRLGYAVEHKNGTYNDAARAWYQTFDYDRYGNRGINVANTSDNADGADTALQLSDFSAANNRITHAGYVYDAAGNLTAEPGKSYTYDAENRIVRAEVAGGVVSQYFYDGNGRRVKKAVGGVGTRFEYGAGGELIAERNDTNGTVTKGYLYRGGELLATTTNGTAYEYATADHLGTPRAWTDNSGNLIAGGRHDYLPFGEELFAGVGTRAAEQGYASHTQQDGQRKQFTGKERDDETGLDFFGARYFASVQGRFTSPDPLLSSGNPELPDTWNRYSYSLNNPLRFIDPTGLYVFDRSVTPTQRKQFDDAIANAQKTLAKIGKLYGTNSSEYKKAERALSVYGDPGIDNGVTIFNKQLGELGGQVDHVIRMKKDGTPKINVKIDTEQFSESIDLQQTIFHEGSHAADGSDFARGIAKNPSLYQTEFDAYTVTSLFQEASGYRGTTVLQAYTTRYKNATVVHPPSIVSYYESRWGIDKETMRAYNIDTLLKQPKRAGGAYGVTQKRPGDPVFQIRR
jgi:RHS repeat-associated protein